MIKIVGIILLLVFILFASWVLVKTIIETNYIINKKIQKSGHKGNYYQLKKTINKKNKRRIR